MNRQSERTLKTAYKINIRQIEIYDLDLSKTSEEVIFIRGNWNKNEGLKKFLWEPIPFPGNAMPGGKG